MKIGIISDTHGKLPTEVFDIFAGVDQVIHAGDIGNQHVIDELKVIAPVRAIYGNMDTFPLVSRLNRMEFFALENYSFCLTHNIGSPKAFTYELFKMNRRVDFVIYGHTHQPEKTEYNQVIFINPGSVVQPRYSRRGSVAILEINGGEIKLEFIHLEK